MCLQRRSPRFDPWIWKIPWRREWQPTSVFLPGEFHGQRSLVGKELDMTEWLTLLLSFPLATRENSLQQQRPSTAKNQQINYLKKKYSHQHLPLYAGFLSEWGFVNHTSFLPPLHSASEEGGSVSCLLPESPWPDTILTHREDQVNLTESPFSHL